MFPDTFAVLESMNLVASKWPVQGSKPVVKEHGGRDRDRTGDPLLAKQVLSQLSYTPTNKLSSF
jgi:hypothetical protein